MKTLFVILVAACLTFAQTAAKPTPAAHPAPPADVQAWMTTAKSAGAKTYRVRCFGQHCTAMVGFADGSSLHGQGSTRAAAMAAIDWKKPHPKPAPPAPPQNWGGPL
jgi:hypothetical protein